MCFHNTSACCEPPQRSAYKQPGFTVRLTLADKTIEFQPEFVDFEGAILGVYDKMLSSVSLIPRIETKLFSETVRNSLLSSHHAGPEVKHISKS